MAMRVREPVRYRRDEDGKRRRVVVFHGQDGYELWATVSCSGCTELGEYGGNPGYPYDATAKCLVGAGCDECGYTGKRRNSYWISFAGQAERWTLAAGGS